MALVGWSCLVACTALVAIFPLFAMHHRVQSMLDLVHITHFKTGNALSSGFTRFKPFYTLPDLSKNNVSFFSDTFWHKFLLGKTR